tara:strand:- start:232 stop:897 length:666 start_codon:yes stop_codon:yes gene_type:complete
MAYIGREPIYGKFERQSLTADGSTTTFTLNYTIGSAASILVNVAGVVQEPGVAYTLGTGGTQIVFSAAPASTDNVYCVFLGVLTDVAVIDSGSITNQTELATTANGDLLLVYDTSAGDLKKIQTQNLVSPSNKVLDADSDTQIQVEEGTDEDIIRFDTAGTERMTMNSSGKIALTTNGGGLIHNNAIANSFSLSSENMILAGPVSVSGTITVDANSTLVVV